MDPAPRAILRTEGLGRRAGGRALVEDVSVEVLAGEVLAVVGPSGAGKSSFLRLLDRLDEPTSGRVLLDGRDVRELPPRELRRRVGMVMQAPALFPGSVADNVRFGPAQRGERLQDGAVAELLAQVQLPGFADRPVDHLSGGEAQRVSVARALANRPEVLLLDEPTSALDGEARRALEELLARIVRERALTCVVVTHDLGQAARLAGRALVLAAGRVRRLGPAEEVLRAGAALP